MAIGVYFKTNGMTAAQYDEIMKQLGAAGKLPSPGMISHVCFGPDDNLDVFDTWESEAHFTEFGKTLLPILEAAGVKPSPPHITNVYNALP